MITCCDDTYDGVDDDTTIYKKPWLIEFFNTHKICFKEYYLLNNKDIYRKPDTNTKLRLQVEDGYWNNSTKSFEKFFETLKASPPINLTLTRTILEQTHNIHMQLPSLIEELKSNINEIETLEQDWRKTKKLITESDELDHTIEVAVTETVMKDTDPNYFSTYCVKCNVVCHYPCTIHENNLIRKSLWWCSKTSWFNRQFTVHCTACEGKCSWRDHCQSTKTEKTITYHKKCTVQELEEEVKSKKTTCYEKQIDSYKKLMDGCKAVEQCIKYINEHSLSIHPTTIREYICDFIELEEEIKADGYQLHIYYLKKIIEAKDQDSLSDEEQATEFFKRY